MFFQISTLDSSGNRLAETQGFKNFEQRMIKLREKLNNEEKVNG